MVHGKLLVALAAIAVPALAQNLAACAASVLVLADPLYEFTLPNSGMFKLPVQFDATQCAGYELRGNVVPLPFGEREFDGRFGEAFNSEGLFTAYAFDNAFINIIGSPDFDSRTFGFDGQVIDPNTNLRAEFSTSGQPETRVITFGAEASATVCEQSYQFTGYEVDPDTFENKETTFEYAANDATLFSMTFTDDNNGPCRRDMYVDWSITGDDGSRYACDRETPAVRPTGQGTITCQVAVGTLAPGVAYSFSRPDAPTDRPELGAVPLAPSIPPVFIVSRPPPSALEQCGASVLSDQGPLIQISGDGSGVRYDTGIQYSPLCEGFTYSLSLVILDDGQASDYAYGATQTFDANPDGTTRAYYPFDTTIRSMNDANEQRKSLVKFTFRGEVSDGQGGTYTIPVGSQVEFQVVTNFWDPDAADCESGIRFQGFELDENFNTVEASYEVSQGNTSLFTFDLYSYPDGVCRPEMYTDFFLSSDAGANIPCNRVNYPTKVEDFSGISKVTCQAAWNTLSTTALYTINFADAPEGRPNSGAVPLAPPTRPTFRVSQPGSQLNPCAESFVYAEPSVTYVFKSNGAGPVAPTNFMYTVSYSAAFCTGLQVSGSLSRPAGGSDVAGSTITLTADGSFTMDFAISVADMDNQMTDPKRPYQFNGGIAVTVDGTASSTEIIGPEFIFKYIEYPDADLCGETISFPDLSPSRNEIGSVDFLTTDLDNFATRIAYTNNGYCERGQFIDLKLTNTGGVEYSCARHVPDIEFTGGGVITCERVKGTMSTLVVWALSDLNPQSNFGKRRDGGVVYAGTQQFRVTHSDDAQATGGLRRRQRQVQAGLEVPSDIQCLPGHEICPVPGRLGSWECLDTTSMLDACGGCPQSGGKDCTEIAGIATVACEIGVCIVKECDEGHTLTKDASGCVPLTNSIRWSAI